MRPRGAPTAGQDALPDALTRRAKKIPHAGLRAAAMLAVLIITVAVIGLDAPAAAAQSDASPPTFVSSTLDRTAGTLEITFSEAMDVTPATNVVPAKIHIRESGNYTHGVTLTAAELGTTADGATISFTLTEEHLATVSGLTEPELTIEPGAVRDTSGNLIVGTFDVSTATFVSPPFDVSTQEATPTGMAFSNDGTKMFVIGQDKDNVNEYTLSTPFDVSTAFFANVTFSVSTQEARPTGMAFSNDGTKMFVIGRNGDNVNEYTLTTAFDVSTATFVSPPFDVSTQEATPTGMAFSNDGTKMFVIGSSGDDVNEYTLTTAFDVSTANFTGTTSIPPVEVPPLDPFQEGNPTGMAFSNDGTKMFVIAQSAGYITEYTLSTPFDASTITVVSSPFDIPSGVGIPTGMAFSNDGAKMFVIGRSGNGVNEYDLSSVYPITVTATMTNADPVLDTIGPRSVNERESLTFMANATDADSDTLMFSLAGTVPTGASITSGGAFSWTPLEPQDGTHTITVQVDDGNNGTDSETITVTVNEVNQAPALGSIPDVKADEGTAIEFDADATDDDVISGDPDSLTYSLEGDAVPGASLNGATGVFSWTPTEQQDGSYLVTVRVTDGSGESATETLDITVYEVNQAPALGSIPDVKADEGTAIEFDADATDDDVINDDPDSLTYSLEGDAVPGASLNGATGVFSWTPTEQQDGSYLVTVRVTDGSGESATETLDITVYEVNQAPALGSIPDVKADEGTAIEFDADATDDDVINDDPDSLTYSLEGDAVPGASLNGATGVFSWTPTEQQDGSYLVTVRVTDGSGESATETLDITVYEVNQAPALGSIPDVEGDEGTAIEFDADATDGDVINDDPDSLTYSLEGSAVPGASLDAATGEFSWTPTEQQDGTYSVTVRVTDGSGESDTRTLDITVREVNESPTAEAGTYLPHGEGVTVRLDGINSTDSDTIGGVPDTRSYSWVQMGTGHTVTLSSATAASPTFTSPTVFENVTLTFELTVTDGSGATAKDTATVMITDDINEIPAARAGLDETFDEGGTTVTLDGSGSSDPNDDSLTYEWEQTAGTPSVTLSGATTSRASFTTPVVASSQDLTFTLTVTDSRGGWHTDDVVITIRDSESNAPIANIAGGSRNANENVTVTLDGSGSSDPNDDSLTFVWAQTGGVPVVNLSANNDTATFDTPVVKEETDLTFTLTVDDGSESGSTSVVVTVLDNEPNDPTAVATGPATADEDQTVTLEGSGSSDPNPGDTLTFTWAPPQGVTLLDADTAFPTFVAPRVFQDADYSFTLTVRDTDGNEAQDAVTVRVLNSQNEPPDAAASSGTGGEADEGEAIRLDGSGSSDPNPGDTLDYSWEYLTGTPPLTIQGNDTASPTFVAPQVKAPTELEFRLTVTDQHDDSDAAEVAVTVLDSHSNLPVSDPGGDQTVGEGAVVTLDGTDSYDPNGDGISYAWEQVGATTVSLSDPNSAVTTFGTPQVSRDTVLEFALRVTDVDGSHTETVSVTVQNSQTNTPVARPQVSGGVHEGETVTLDGTDSYDPNGDQIGHSWTQVSGDAVALSGANTDTATFQAPRVPDPVTLVFQLAVSDDITTGTASLSVVIPDDRNDPPILEPVPAQTKDELQAVSFQAAASDVDGNDLRFALAGEVPRGAAMTRDGSFSWTPDQSQDGPYSLNVTVSDGDGGTDSQLVQVTINDIEPRPVSARASGSSITFTLSEPVLSEGAPPNGFSIQSGNSVAIESISGSGTDTLTLSLNATISRGDTISYDQTGDVQDETGKALESFEDLAISFPSRSKSTVLPPAIIRESQGYPQTSAPLPGTVPDGPLSPVPANGTLFPLMINQNSYALYSHTGTVIPTSVTAGQQVTISVTMYDPSPIEYFAAYLNLQEDSISHLQSDTRVVWDSGHVRVIDPNGLMHNATIILSEDPGYPTRKTATITTTFSEEMGNTNMVIRTWNAASKITEVRIFDALAVTALVDPEPGAEPSIMDPEPTAILDAVDPEPVAGQDSAERSLLAIRMWSGFEPESMTDAQLLDSLGLDYPGMDIPNWVMTELGVLAAKGEVTVDEFRTALEYVLGNA